MSDSARAEVEQQTRQRLRVLEPSETRRELRNGDADERFEVVHWPVDEIDARLDEIADAKTLAGLLLYLRERGI